MGRVTKDIGIPHLVERQIRFWEAEQRAIQVQKEQKEPGAQKALPGPYLTISRDFGTGGISVAEKVAERLGWTVYDREIVEYMAGEAHVRERVIQSFDERLRDQIEHWVLSLIDQEAFGHDYYLRYLLQVLMAIAQHGQAVIVGRGANFVLPSACGLRVKMMAPLEQRVPVVAQRENLEIAAARKLIIRTDNQRAAFIRYHFHRDTNDPLGYDLLINTDVLSDEAVVGIILEGVEEKLGVTPTD
jgi:cytidylate kinase